MKKIKDKKLNAAKADVRRSIFDCERCGAVDEGGGIGGWSVNTELWNETMLANGYADKSESGSVKGMICIDCFEKMLGRKLNKADFTNTGDNRTSAVVQKYFA